MPIYFEEEKKYTQKSCGKDVEGDTVMNQLQQKFSKDSKLYLSWQGKKNAVVFFGCLVERVVCSLVAARPPLPVYHGVAGMPRTTPFVFPLSVRHSLKSDSLDKSLASLRIAFV